MGHGVEVPRCRSLQWASRRFLTLRRRPLAVATAGRVATSAEFEVVGRDLEFIGPRRNRFEVAAVRREVPWHRVDPQVGMISQPICYQATRPAALPALRKGPFGGSDTSSLPATRRPLGNQSGVPWRATSLAPVPSPRATHSEPWPRL